jgi:CBS domain-containing protein
MTVAAILKHKGRKVVHVDPTNAIMDVAALLVAHNIGAALVLDKAGSLLGIISERDIMHEIAASGARALDMTAGELMTQNITIASPATRVDQAMTMMTAGRFRHLPVVDGGVIVGIVSIGDVVKRVIDEKSSEVDSLRAYVAGAA